MAAVLLSSCTDTGLYATSGYGAGGPDRAEFTGTVCVPLAAGDSFPVKVLYAFQGGVGLDTSVRANLVEALQALSQRFSEPYISFGLVGFHTVATGLQGSFVDAAKIATDAVPKYSSYSTEAGPISLRAPLKLAKSLLSGDMLTGCRGQVARGRYLVVLVFTDADTSCANPAFNAGISQECNRYLPDQRACSVCELGRVAAELKSLEDRYLAGEVSIQPVYVRSQSDPLIAAQAGAIARSGGTEVIETDPSNLKNALNSLNYASLQRSLTLKRLIAFNRNALARAGQLVPDSDGDGVPDADEVNLGLDPQNPDSDGDLLGDGVELRMGMRPQPDPLNIDVINGCNPFLDTDGDRLNDCEERVLGTDPCIADHDGDAVPELIEVLAGTNPLVAEDLQDDDRDGLTNIGEVEAHTDPHSADIAYRADRGYGYFIHDADPTPDGRACYDIRVFNVGLVHTLDRPSEAPPLPRGMNDIYLYAQVGRNNDPRGTGIGSLFIQRLQFIPPQKRKPKGIININPDEFVVGN